ncbi:MAG: class I SAM-dependent methyltransferase [Chloroflexi bacterium]|nr:class I SAM-dependent methyltransferase [Chloroflexota bacterium]
MNEATLPAQLYYLHHSQVIDDLPYWLQLAQAKDGPLLELGCGTGRVLRYLAKAGQIIYGIDYDAQMLKFLQSTLPSAMQQSVHLVQADITAFHFQQEFGLIILPCNTLSTLTSSAQRKALICVRQHLCEDGIFAVSMPNPSLLADLSSDGETNVEDTFPHPQSGEPIQVSSEWVCTEQAVTFHWHYDHLLANGRVTRFTVSIKHFLQSVQAVEKIFFQAGFSKTAKYGDYNQNPYHAESPYLIIQAHC